MKVILENGSRCSFARRRKKRKLCAAFVAFAVEMEAAVYYYRSIEVIALRATGRLV